MFVGAAGVAGQYFLDPAQGARRRSEARDRALALLRRGRQQAEQQAAYATGQAKGAVHQARDKVTADQPKDALTDQELARKVESIIFRDPDVPKGKINVDAAGRTVWLRGEIDSPDMRDELEAATAGIPEVETVENLLHLPDEPAPTRADTPEEERRDTSYSEPPGAGSQAST